MHIINSQFSKLEDDETCALLKPDKSKYPPVNLVVNEILNIFEKHPEVKTRVLLKTKSKDTK